MKTVIGSRRDILMRIDTFVFFKSIGMNSNVTIPGGNIHAGL